MILKRFRLEFTVRDTARVKSGMGEGRRSEKVADLIRREISEIILRSLKDPRIGFVTITKVAVSDDCRMAKIYFSVMGGPAERDQCQKGLTSATGYVRKELGHRLKLRHTPEIKFQFDPSVEYALHLEEVIHHLHEEEQKHHADD